VSTSLLRTNKDFMAIYERHVDTVYRVCFMYMKNEVDTEDMVQTTFLKLWSYGGTFENVEHEKAWLIVTASNLCKNFFRCAWKKYTSFDLQENLAVKKETYDETLEAVLQLPQRYKIVIYLYYYEGYRSNEIARLLNAKESTIRSHLHKGRKLLKEILGRETYEE